MIVRQLNEIIVEINGIREVIPFFQFSFMLDDSKLVIYNANEIAFVVNNPSQELTNELYKSINIKGQKGEQGKAGKDGKDGLDGKDGKNGENGKDGVDGTNGKDGKDGINGKDGERGQVGNDGKDGIDGRDGENGKDGVAGGKGERGEKGNDGINGEKGKDGSNGFNGRDGIDGQDGLGFEYRDNYLTLNTYKIQDVVKWQDNLFVAIKDVPTDEPPTKGVDLNEEYWKLFLRHGRDGRNGRDGIDGIAGSQTFSEINFDVINDSLPIVSTSVNYLNIDFYNFNTNIDLTGQLPVNLPKGARLILRKIDSKQGRIIYNDGVIFYNFVKKKGEYMELIWNGTKFII